MKSIEDVVVAKIEATDITCVKKGTTANCRRTGPYSPVRLQFAVVPNFEQSEFYPLNAMLHTFGSGFRDGRGTFLWYETTLFNYADSLFGFIDVESRHRFASENIFVLEFFPYHSKSFGGMNFFPFLPSFEFWRSLMHYAFTHEKIVVCHGLGASKSLTSAAIRSVDGYSNAKDEGYIYKIVSSENGRSRLLLGHQNVVPLHDNSTRLIDWLSSLQNRT